ncbi:MAG: NAD-dependent epimerase/dehydratase family protein [Rubrivivax sp.]
MHLAAIVTPGPGSNREFEYSVDVLGTRNVLQACVATGVRRLVVTSSGAAYGYHADNPEWIGEEQPLRGNAEFAYADHKRQVEEMLAEARREHPALAQVVFRVGTILGENTRNQITALFDKPMLIAVRGSPSPFVFIWDRDVVGAIERGVRRLGRRVQRRRRRRAVDRRDRAAPGPALHVHFRRSVARRAGGAAHTQALALRARAGRVPLPARAGQPAAEGGVRLRAADDLGRSVQAVLPQSRPGSRSGAALSTALRAPDSAMRQRGNAQVFGG